VKLLIAFNLSYLAILLMFVAKPERLAALPINITFSPPSSRWLHLSAYCLFSIALYLITMQHGWEIGIPIWLSIVMITSALAVSLATLIPRLALFLLVLNIVSASISIWLLLA
jgi:hypothetical protein